MNCTRCGTAEAGELSGLCGPCLAIVIRFRPDVEWVRHADAFIAEHDPTDTA